MIRIAFLVVFFSIYAHDSWADEVYGFCFGNDTSLANVEKILRPFILPSDNFTLRKSFNCVEAALSPERRDLFEKILSGRTRLSKVYSAVSSVEERSNVLKRCQILIVKKNKVNVQQTTTKVGAANVLKENQNETKILSRMEMLLGDGLPGKIEMDGESAELICTEKFNGNYLIQFSLKKETVATTDKDETKSELSSVVMVRKGEIVNLGSIMEDLKKRDRELSINKGLNYQKEAGLSVYEYELSIQ